MLLENTFQPEQDGRDARPQNNFVNVVGRMRRTAKESSNLEDGARFPPTLYVRNRSIIVNQTDRDHYLLTTKKRTPCETEVKKLPTWVEKVDQNLVCHSGEAPIFSENLLPSNKDEQRGWGSNTSATKFFSRRNFSNDADRFCQTHRTRNYLLASQAPPCEENQTRPTRTTILRNAHREQLQSAATYNSAKIEHRRKKDRPPLQNPKCLPTRFQMHDAPNSFLVGTRYNYNQRDIKSFDQIGLYIPRARPESSFLKHFTGADSESYHNFARERKNSMRDQRQKETRTTNTSFDMPNPSQRARSSRGRLDRTVRNYLLKRISSNDFQPRPSTHPTSRSEERIEQVSSIRAQQPREKRDGKKDDDDGIHRIPC